MIGGQFDVAIIGAGIVGSAIAYWLTREGVRSVAIIERSQVGSAASGLNAGTLLVHSKSGQLLRQCIQAKEVWRELAGVLDSTLEYREKEGLQVSYTPREDQLLQESIAEQASLGLDTRYVYGAEVRREFPFLGSEVTSLSICSNAGHANPLRAAFLLSNHARDRGACFVIGARVNRIEARGSRYVLATNRGSIVAERIVIAAGAWSSELCRQLGYEYPVELYVNQCHISDRHPLVLRHVIGSAAGDLTLKQFDSGHVMIGGGWQGSGDLSTGSRVVSFTSIVGNVKQAIRAVPLLGKLRMLRSWSGFEAKTPDRLPLVGELPCAQRVYLAVSGNSGFQLGPLLGRMVAQMLLGEPDKVTLQALSLERFFNARPERENSHDVRA